MYWLCYNHTEKGTNVPKSRPRVIFGLSRLWSRKGGVKTSKLWTPSITPAKAKKEAAPTASSIPFCSSRLRSRKSRGRSSSCSRLSRPSSMSSPRSRLVAVSVISTTCKCRPALPLPESVASSSARRCSQNVRNAPNFAIDRFRGCLFVPALGNATDANYRAISMNFEIIFVTLHLNSEIPIC